jgi:hypothetical protein
MPFSALLLLHGHAASPEEGNGPAWVSARPHRSPTMHAVAFLRGKRREQEESVVDGEARTASRFRTRGHCPVDGLYVYYTAFGLNCNVFSSLHIERAARILIKRSIHCHSVLRGYREIFKTLILLAFLRLWPCSRSVMALVLMCVLSQLEDPFIRSSCRRVIALLLALCCHTFDLRAVGLPQVTDEGTVSYGPAACRAQSCCKSAGALLFFSAEAPLTAASPEGQQSSSGNMIQMTHSS